MYILIREFCCKNKKRKKNIATKIMCTILRIESTCSNFYAEKKIAMKTTKKIQEKTKNLFHPYPLPPIPPLNVFIHILLKSDLERITDIAQKILLFTIYVSPHSRSRIRTRKDYDART